MHNFSSLVVDSLQHDTLTNFKVYISNGFRVFLWFVDYGYYNLGRFFVNQVEAGYDSLHMLIELELDIGFDLSIDVFVFLQKTGLIRDS